MLFGDSRMPCGGFGTVRSCLLVPNVTAAFFLRSDGMWSSDNSCVEGTEPDVGGFRFRTCRSGLTSSPGFGR